VFLGVVKGKAEGDGLLAVVARPDVKVAFPVTRMLGVHRVADEATQAGDLDRAVEAYTKLLTLDLTPMGEVIALASRGKVRMKQREYRAAIQDFERALEQIDYPDLHDLLDEARALEAGERPLPEDAPS